MSKRGRVILSVIVGLLVLLAGALDVGDLTPVGLRWAIGLVASAGVAWVTWWASGRRSGPTAGADSSEK